MVSLGFVTTVKLPLAVGRITTSSPKISRIMEINGNNTISANRTDTI